MKVREIHKKAKKLGFKLKKFKNEPYYSLLEIRGKYFDEYCPPIDLEDINDTLNTMADEREANGIDNSSLASIFYIIVHDFEEDIEQRAKSQLKHGLSDQGKYKLLIKKIWIWAKKNQYPGIEERAENMYKQIRIRRKK